MQQATLCDEGRFAVSTSDVTNKEAHETRSFPFDMGLPSWWAPFYRDQAQHLIVKMLFRFFFLLLGSLGNRGQLLKKPVKGAHLLCSLHCKSAHCLKEPLSWPGSVCAFHSTILFAIISSLNMHQVLGQSFEDPTMRVHGQDTPSHAACAVRHLLRHVRPILFQASEKWVGFLWLPVPACLFKATPCTSSIIRNAGSVRPKMPMGARWAHTSPGVHRLRSILCLPVQRWTWTNCDVLRPIATSLGEIHEVSLRSPQFRRVNHQYGKPVC